MKMLIFITLIFSLFCTISFGKQPKIVFSTDSKVTCGLNDLNLEINLSNLMVGSVETYYNDIKVSFLMGLTKEDCLIEIVKAFDNNNLSGKTYNLKLGINEIIKCYYNSKKCNNQRDIVIQPKNDFEILNLKVKLLDQELPALPNKVEINEETCKNVLKSQMKPIIEYLNLEYVEDVFGIESLKRYINKKNQSNQLANEKDNKNELVKHPVLSLKPEKSKSQEIRVEFYPTEEFKSTLISGISENINFLNLNANMGLGFNIIPGALPLHNDKLCFPSLTGSLWIHSTKIFEIPQSIIYFDTQLSLGAGIFNPHVEIGIPINLNKNKISGQSLCFLYEGVYRRNPFDSLKSYLYYNSIGFQYNLFSPEKSFFKLGFYGTIGFKDGFFTLAYDNIKDDKLNYSFVKLGINAFCKYLNSKNRILNTDLSLIGAFNKKDFLTPIISLKFVLYFDNLLN